MHHHYSGLFLVLKNSFLAWKYVILFFLSGLLLLLLLPLISLYSVSVQLYSPLRPVVDIAEVFLWLMAVGTIIFASYWSAWSAREAAIEHDKLLKVKLYFQQLFCNF